MKKFGLILIPFAVFYSLFAFDNVFGAISKSKETRVFVVPQDSSEFNVAESLQSQKFIKNAKGFSFLLNTFGGGAEINPGGYKLSSDMNAWEVVKKITGKYDLTWVSIKFCLRKEQIGEILAESLEWSTEELNSWNTLYKPNSEYFEGVYYPDTYLLPLDETPKQIAQRFINRFNEKISPLLPQYSAKNIKWTTGVKIASLIARESGGIKDTKLISGIIWNRLNKNMALQIDATMQYTLGKNENGKWWGSIDLSQKKSDSPYNSYLNKGLPPTPICSPGIDEIAAAVDPEETDCLFYLHDVYKEIHCAKTYKEHLANIKKYLNY